MKLLAAMVIVLSWIFHGLRIAREHVPRHETALLFAMTVVIAKEAGSQRQTEET